MSSTSAMFVYWRPGCPFCTRLFRFLDHAGVEVERVNIWEDDAGADFVRSVAGGNETVPTVKLGTITLVNPSRYQMRSLMSDSSCASEVTLGMRAVDVAGARLLKRGFFSLYVLAVATASFTAESIHHPAVSWSIDVLGIGLYLWYRRMRRRRNVVER